MTEEPKSSRSSQASTAAQQQDAKHETRLDSQIDALLAGRHADPFSVLGPHPIWSPLGHGWAIRFFRPDAAEASVLLEGATEPIPARRLRPEGFFEATLPDSHQGAPPPNSYRIRFRSSQGQNVEAFDTYAFPYLLSEFDLHLRSEERRVGKECRSRWWPYRYI